ncbi:MAG TPA: TonB family protein [Candidatus Acidoferrum sp.]|nr:TonB family protein [Candidatus Acidoferrum sp.]
MAPSSKENELLTATPEKAGAVSVAAGPRHEDTATGSRPQPVALEVPVTVNGARTVEGSDKREPFSETTKTVLVFGNGAVIRLGSPVSAGQLLFLTNEKTKKEVVCQVVKSKNYKSVSGYVELEFTESVVGFWGMRFPSDRIGAPVPAATSVATLPTVSKSNFVAPISSALKPVSPVVSAAPKIPEIKPAQVQASQIHAEMKPAPQPRPAEISVVAPAAPKPQAPSVQNTAAPVTPFANKTDVPVMPAPTITSSLASSLASLLSSPEVPPAVAASKPPSPAPPSENKQPPPSVVRQDSTEELKFQAARLQEQLSSMLFSATPATNPATPAPTVTALDPKAGSGVAAQVFEIAKSEPVPVKAALPAKTPPPIKSSLDTEEVKIPSWLEPLARNAATPAPPDLAEREKAKQVSEIAAREEHSAEPLPITAVESVPESALPAFGSLLPLDEPVITHERSSSGSGRGVLYGAIAAAVLLAAGGVWYFLQPTKAAQGTSVPFTSAPSSQASSPAPAVAQPVSQPASQISTTTPQPNSSSNATPVSSAPASAPFIRAPQNPQPVPATRDNTRGAGTTIPAAATERISRPPAEPEPKKPALGEVHLASPTMNRAATAQDDGAEAPAIPSSNADENAGGLDSGLAAGNGKQPTAPEAPLPVGGDVKAAKLISSVAPVYPILAKNQHVSGNVVIDALIDETGHVTTAKVISGPALLHQAAMAAVRQWKYQPASLDGKPVSMHLSVTLQFRPQ